MGDLLGNIRLHLYLSARLHLRTYTFHSVLLDIGGLLIRTFRHSAPDLVR